MKVKVDSVIILMILAIALLVIGIPLQGWVLTILWGWFLVPLGIPEIGIISALGIIVILRLITHQPTEAKEGWVDLFPVILPLGALLLGYIIRLFA